MCDLCDLIDYPVADCWRPCYVPALKPTQMPLLPRGAWSDESEILQQTVSDLIRQVKALRYELKHHPQPKITDEGIE